METTIYQSVPPQLIPALEAALLKHEEAVAKLADFKKQYTSVKNKAKRAEKYIANLEEEEGRRLHEITMTQTVQYAENKFILINKKLNRFKEQDEKSLRRTFKQLKGTTPLEPHTAEWHIQGLTYHTSNLNDMLREVADMLRIAKGHLRKIDDMKKSIARYRKLRKPL
ncbi:MAG: hypothetical protein H6603_01110 [Flavobacteriales bacterium]|nr:hypothetical protein [Flavobacteriales bacterium]MCB9192672.1 hypothetical protein [Flavobacteriales bacterium]MCB9203548.1 hypothetical protein [Flavobacteriales bacterium]